MRWSEIYESASPRSIEFDFDGGTVEGYSVESSAVQLPNWMSRYGIHNDSLVEDIRIKYPKIAMLNNINVEEESRGEGMGNDLLESFESEAFSHGAKAVLLIADIGESQNEGFNLVSWYSKMGYQKIIDSVSGPLMVKPL